jgi:transposase-like protein
MTSVTSWSAGPSPRLAVRARIVLACAEPGVVYQRVAADLGVPEMTTAKWRERFTARLDGLVGGELLGRYCAVSTLPRRRLPPGG